ncbi:hypothetical protein [Thermoactinospora rubra]|uniref:hypothetical protein n=1 Tax=Thermoactinospora rubra TaxID=1088767 RepID=UPI001F0AA0A3|nr:hypothetical protein [Thermoactinospora rubra]
MLREVRAFAVTVAALSVLGAVLGVPAGLAWSWAAPRAPYVRTGSGLVLADPMTQALIAADGWFAVITGGLGLAGGVAVWLLARRRGVAAVLGLCVGGLAGAFVAYGVGTRFTVGSVTVAAAAPGAQVVPGALVLTAPGVLVSWAFLAVAAFGVLEGVAAYRRSPLRRPYGISDRPPEGP